MIKLGYSLGGSKPKCPSIKERVDIVLSVQNHAVEISYLIADRLKDKLDSNTIKKIKEFKFISIHAPIIIDNINKEWVKYPSLEGNAFVDQILKVAEDVNADIILFHPDLIGDFKWLNEKIGKRLAFENMDIKKSFGKTVEDLKKVFIESPQAKWVCDVNHIYTMDQSMKLSTELHKNFKDRLAYYHLSGYGGHHDALHVSQEDIILEGIKDFSVPIIDEGKMLKDGLESLLKENEYILERLKI